MVPILQHRVRKRQIVNLFKRLFELNILKLQAQMGLISQPKLILIFIDLGKEQSFDFSPSISQTGISIGYLEAMQYRIA